MSIINEINFTFDEKRSWEEIETALMEDIDNRRKFGWRGFQYTTFVQICRKSTKALEFEIKKVPVGSLKFSLLPCKTKWVISLETLSPDRKKVNAKLVENKALYKYAFLWMLLATTSFLLKVYYIDNDLLSIILFISVWLFLNDIIEWILKNIYLKKHKKEMIATFLKFFGEPAKKFFN